MYQVIDDNVVLSVNDWMKAGLSYVQFRMDSQRGYLSIYRRGQHGETLIDVHSIKRADRLMAIEKAFGAVGRKDDVAKHSDVVRDLEAFNYYKDYVYGDKEIHLPDERIEEYTNNASILTALTKRLATLRAHRRVQMGEFYTGCVDFAMGQQTKGFPNTLPTNARAFERRLKNFQGEGYQSLISKNYGNDAAVRLSADAKDWAVARFATPINKVTIKQLWVEYNAIAATKGWKTLKSSNTLYKYLNEPETKAMWWGMRYGELKAKEKYTRFNKTILPECRDAIWYGDGTKLNYYYLNEKGEISTCNVYEVVDVYSEVLLGYHISASEDFEAQYFSYKMAMQKAGHTPYEIRFDNQGGHKKLNNCDFFKKMAHLAIATQPYNGKSKTIESIFGRFQAEFLHHDWFFTGQNITAKKNESRQNMEFILANKSNLPTLDEVKKTYEERRREWNTSPHPDTGIPRIEMYEKSVNDKSKAVGLAEMLDMFGLMDEETNKYRSNGIQKTIKGHKYTWEVLTVDGQPDLDFLRKNVDRSFHIEYDPTDLTTVALYVKDQQGNMRFVTFAQKYIEIHRAKQEQDTLDCKFIKHNELANKDLRVDMRNDIEEKMERWGLHPSQHGLNMPKLAGIEKGNEATGKRNKDKKKVKEESIGEYTKATSNVVQDIEGDYNYLDNY